MEYLPRDLPPRTGLTPAEAIHFAIPERIRAEALIFEDGGVTVLASADAVSPRCPACGQPSRRLHSRYYRTLVDLPWGGVREYREEAVGLHVQPGARQAFVQLARECALPGTRGPVQVENGPPLPYCSSAIHCRPSLALPRLRFRGRTGGYSAGSYDGPARAPVTSGRRPAGACRSRRRHARRPARRLGNRLCRVPWPAYLV